MSQRVCFIDNMVYRSQKIKIKIQRLFQIFFNNRSNRMMWKIKSDKEYFKLLKIQLTPWNLRPLKGLWPLSSLRPLPSSHQKVCCLVCLVRLRLSCQACTHRRSLERSSCHPCLKGHEIVDMTCQSPCGANECLHTGNYLYLVPRHLRVFHSYILI